MSTHLALISQVVKDIVILFMFSFSVAHIVCFALVNASIKDLRASLITS